MRRRAGLPWPPDGVPVTVAYLAALRPTLAEELERRRPGLSVVVGRPLARHPVLLSLLADWALSLLEDQPGPWDCSWSRPIAGSTAATRARRTT